MSKIVIIGISFAIGVGVGWIAQGGHWSIFLTSYVPALATLLAAYYGAKFAFQFQKDKEKTDIQRRNIVSGNIAIFDMSRMVSNLRNIQQQFIDPVRNVPLRCIQMQPLLHSFNEIKLNIDTLHFLLETDDRNLLGELGVENSRYQTSMAVINDRSRLHHDEVQPALERAKFAEGGYYSAEDLESALGVRLYKIIQQSTEVAIEHIDNTVISLQDSADKLRDSLKKQYPNETIIGFI